MSRRRRRVSGSSAKVLRLEVATGGDPTRALVRALESVPRKPGQIWSIAVSHDGDCPAFVHGGPMAICSCEIVALEARRAA